MIILLKEITSGSEKLKRLIIRQKYEPLVIFRKVEIILRRGKKDRIGVEINVKFLPTIENTGCHPK